VLDGRGIEAWAHQMNSFSFQVAAFGPDGDLVGSGQRLLSDLSEKWLQICDELLADGRPSARLRVPLAGLEHLEIRYTRAGCAGVATFFAHGVIVTSSLLLGGVEPEVAKEVQEMFFRSLGPQLGVQAALAELALSEISRPLHAVVAWASPGVTDADADMVQELTTHFAGSLLFSGSHVA
jgi:hypothetical protein